VKTPPPPLTHDAARRIVRGPATALVAIAILMYVLSAISVYFSIFSEYDWSLDLWQRLHGASDNPTWRDWVQGHIDEHNHRNRSLETVFVVLVTICRVIVYSFVLLAGLRMRALRSYGIVMIGAILTLIFNGAFCAGLPVGIWALLVLCRPGVREAFAGESRA
jgi:hypothetical protein